ncbi:adenylate and guanylate cyclase catalytic domain-containing protein [Fimicolochytrium jonesii]|uniref:adenylate and guanylate cyclase catalytic domain-containing protein n=1 Tax=Fimicolochytrium jonesii TaxID=1396493 RepID=UPI0022FE6E8C|nr:adenylate and guanylate cyclase catalytic domain-containing protein [Fimicolochytrium jonesii]KAI8822703.1 adenylate and guanylate cyclase catalytic domain-containing protein [Fimicolochytrium jonesii]
MGTAVESNAPVSLFNGDADNDEPRQLSKSVRGSQALVNISDADRRNKFLSEAVLRDRNVKEQKLLAQRRLVHFQEEETNIFEANLKEARQLYESQLVEQRLVEWRQRSSADDMLKDEERKSDLVKLVVKMGALKIKLNLQDEARGREIAFREKVKLKRDAHSLRVKKMEERQKKEREELLTTQGRIARNAKLVQALEVRGMDEMQKRKYLREYEIQSQQLAMKQQKEAEQLREIQLLKIRHISEVVQMEMENMTEIEDLHADQRLREQELEAENRTLLQAEEDKLDRQQAKLKALQLKEEQKIQRNVLKQTQRKQSKLLDRQQRSGVKMREKLMMSENAGLLSGSDNGGDGSDIDPSETVDTSSYGGTSVASRSDYGGEENEEVDPATRATTESNAATDAELRRKRTATNDAEKELQEALAKGRERVRQMFLHQKKMVDELKTYHKEVRDQKAREHKRKMAELNKDQEDELRQVKTEQAQEMEELLETIGHQDLIAAQQSSFDKQMDTLVSNQLLGNMLPKHVAEELKAGRTPEPASFENVALFFTDIYGFKELATKSSPRQIVALLNRMYIAFDEVIGKYPDLYKVETVMDSFMVCSGLSGNTKKSREDCIHDAEVAVNCALELLAAVQHIDMSDQLVDKVNLRIGIQCGPVLAGVIGTKMPHYCLFGDTVNVASRMCSTNEPLKLQVSAAMAGYLEGKYQIEDRGTIHVKGKGEMKTFWVSGNA